MRPPTASSRTVSRGLFAALERGRRSLGSTCCICRRWTEETLCQSCEACFASTRPRCPRCALPLAAPAAGAACEACRAAPPPWHSAVAAVDYDHPWDRLVVAMKRSSDASGAAAFAALLDRAMVSAPAPIDCVVPVPLSASRLRERGFNQAWEIARRLAIRDAGPAFADALVRIVDAPSLATLGRRARHERLRGAFMVSPTRLAALRGRRVALVDDVATTGATLAAATAALLKHGAAEVHVRVFARTPAPSR